MQIKINKLFLVFATAFIIFIILFPNIVKAGVSDGLIICANVIIPSLFPFAFCLSVIIKSNVSLKNKYINKITYKLFGHNCEMFLFFVFSLIGGYPIGAKFINELYIQKTIDNKTANTMLMYCVNAGPAFIISAIGCGVFNSQKIGVIIYCAHILSSLIMAYICSFSIKKLGLTSKKTVKKQIEGSQLLILSVSDTTQSILSICSFVILFSCINKCLEYAFGNVSIIKYIPLFTEVTSSIIKYKNVYLASFLLGFSGISIWLQVIALSNGIKINYFKFILGRILHGAFSLLITNLLLVIFKVKVTVFNNVEFTNQIFYSRISLFISIFIMLLVLITFIYTKNNSGKLIKDVI